MKKYYVYAWFNEDTEEIFYIGMGKGNRAFIKDYNSRSKRFIDYYKSHNCDMMFLEVQLTFEDACQKEKEYIKYYKSIGQCICNITLDGKGGAGCGEYNSNYKNGEKLKQRYVQNPELKEKTKHCGGQNGRAIPVSICNERFDVIKEYDCMTDCAKYLIENGITDGKVATVTTAISKAIKTKRPYKGYYFK